MGKTQKRLLDSVRKAVPKPTKVIKSRKQQLRDKEDYQEIIENKGKELNQLGKQND